MSHISATRTALKTALDSVDGVTGYIYQPTSPKAGDSWPRMSQAARDGSQFVHGWTVLVYLPQDETKADQWIDEHIDDLVDAIEDQQVAFVESYEPVNLGDDNSFRYGLMLVTRSE